MPTMWSNDRILYAAGRDELKEPESAAPAAPDMSVTGAQPPSENPPKRQHRSLRSLIGRLLDPHLLPEDDSDIGTPLSRR